MSLAVRLMMLAGCLILVLHAMAPVTIWLSHTADARGRQAEFVVLVRVAPHVDNRELCISFDGPEYRRSCGPLDGKQAPISHWRRWHTLSTGEYEAAAVLVRVVAGKRKHYVATTRFHILGHA